MAEYERSPALYQAELGKENAGLSSEEERRLSEIILKRGDRWIEARNKLVEGNLCFAE